MNTKERLRYEASPSMIVQELTNLHKTLKRKAIVIVDEIQKVPELTDNIQILIDDNIATFIITSSSARKIKNLLPGRVIKFILSPLTLHEIKSFDTELNQLLTYGSLPGIFDLNVDTQKFEDLDSYVNLYLDEEIRKEALVRNIGAFSNFLQLASIESGNITNFSKISQDIGVSHSTIAEYYQILVDCMLATKIEALSITNTRRKLTKAPKFIIFDLGVRMLAAKDNTPSIKDLPHLFEQFVGLELMRIINTEKLQLKLLFWRDHAGPEINFVLANNQNYIPIEVKWTTQPTVKDIKHLKQFKYEYNVQGNSYIICQTPRAFDLEDGIVALPWQDLAAVFNDID